MKEYLKQLPYKLKKYKSNGFFLFSDILVQYICGIIMFAVMQYQFSDIANIFNIQHMFICLSVLALCTIFFYILFRMYGKLWRYAKGKEYLLLFLQSACSYTMYFLIGIFFKWLRIPLVLLLGISSLSIVFMLLIRFSMEICYKRTVSQSKQDKTYVAIVGAGDGGNTLLDEMQRNPESPYIPYCFFDDDPDKIGKFIRNVEVKGSINQLPKILSDTPVGEVIIAIPSLNNKRRKEIVDICMTAHMRVKLLPSMLNLIEDGNLSRQMREVQIEDLLGREPIKLNNSCVNNMLKGQVVMVTGGGGSIGSELSRQIAACNPKQLIILDIYENNAYYLQQELKQKYGRKLNLKIEIASVRDDQRMNELIRFYRPDYIYHAAAHKHVPLMEDCPGEAIKNNVFGTYNTAIAARCWGVKKFVLISTDKAVNPTNVMGATKRLCELIVQSLNKPGSTEFCAVRFGNVLGSNGSVIPHFQHQISIGGPVTITDKRIIRYFMSIPEAAQLVLQAGAIAKTGEVFVLDMGEPVKILSLAEKLICLSGYQPYIDIPIVEIGLRPGEKLYEELLVQKDIMTKTENSKIFIDHQPYISESYIMEILQSLSNALKTGRDEHIIASLRKAVPTFCQADEVNKKHFEHKNTDNENKRHKISLQSAI